jgi:hypothetical protein
MAFHASTDVKWRTISVVCVVMLPSSLLTLGPTISEELVPSSARQLRGVRTQTHNLIKAREHDAGSDISMLQMVAEVVSVMPAMKVRRLHIARHQQGPTGHTIKLQRMPQAVKQ